MRPAETPGRFEAAPSLGNFTFLKASGYSTELILYATPHEQGPAGF